MLVSSPKLSFGCVFFAVCAVTLFVGCPSVEPVSEASLYERQVEGNVFDTAPVRGLVKPLIYTRGSFSYRCSECHDDLQRAVREGDLKGEHRTIQTASEHGPNMTCLNCHHETERSAYVNHDGSLISHEKVEQLCAKCHGPIYREWQVGIHGRQNGYWDRTKGRRTKLVCTQCHDPHSPAFASMRPDPAPHYSRFAKEKPAQSSHAPSHAEGH